MSDAARARPGVAPPDAGRPVGAAYLVAVTLAALALRLARLGQPSLWIDEAFTWDLVAPGRGLRFLPQILDAYQGPLYHAAAWLAVRAAPTVAALRLPAAVAGALTVPVAGVLAGRLFGARAGRLAALLLAVSPFHVWYSQEARGYAFVMLWAAVAGVLYLRLASGRPGWREALALAAAGGAGLASNLSFAFLLAAFAVTMLVAHRPRGARAWAAWGVALGGGFVLALPWLLRATGIWAVDRILPGVDTGDALRGATTFTPWALPFAGYSLLYGFSLGPSLAELHLPHRLALLRAEGPQLAAAALIAAAALASALRGPRRAWLAAAWVALPLAAVVLLALRNVKPFNVRYVATALPFLLALVAWGAVRLRRPWDVTLSLAFFVVSLISLTHYYFDPRYAKADVRGAVASLADAPGETLPVLAPNVGPVVRFYAGSREVLGCGNEPIVQSPADAQALVARQLAGRDAAWVIWAHTWHLDPHGRLPAALAAQGDLRRTHEGPGVAVDLWRRAEPPESEP